MLWLPLLRRSKPSVIRVLMAFTIGLLLFLIVDALLEGTEVAGQGSQAFGGSLLVYLGAIVGYLTLSAVDVYMRSRGEAAPGARRPAASTSRCSSRSASASTTSARASRSAPPTRPARSRSAPCS